MPEVAFANSPRPIKQPLSVFGLAAAVLLASLYNAMEFVKCVTSILHSFSASSHALETSAAVYLRALILLFVLTLSIAVLYTISDRRSFGRWLGALCLLAYAGEIACVLSLKFGWLTLLGAALSSTSGRFEQLPATYYLLFIAIVAGWAIYLILSSQSRAYFERRDQNSEPYIFVEEQHGS